MQNKNISPMENSLYPLSFAPIATPVAPMPLNSMSDIRKAFKVGRSTVIEWVNQGAPIAVETDPISKKIRYSAEYNTLQSWRVIKGKIKI